MMPDEVDDHERETLSGRALAWVETLRRADSERIEQLEREVTELRKRAGVAEAYVQSVVAIRNAPYPSQAFTKAITRASEAYHDLLAAFEA